MSAIRAIEIARLREASSRLIQAMADPKRDAEERAAIIKALRVVNDKRAVAGLVNFFDSPQPAALRVEALRTLASLDSAAAERIAVKLLEQSDNALLGEAVQTLCARPEGATLVGLRLLDKKLSANLLPLVTDGLRQHAAKSPQAAKLLTEVMKGALLVSLDPGQVEKVRYLVRTKGDAARGKAIYLGSKTLNCVNCHKLEGLGGQVGPDLTKLWETVSLEKIMESIIEPSKEIKEGYQSFRATTKNGQIYTGLKTIDKPTEIIIREASGRDVRIARDDIDELTPSKVSLMPDNAVAQLSFDQFIDLVAFLKNREVQQSLRGMVTDYWVIGPFGNDLRLTDGPEKSASEEKVIVAEDGRKLQWQRRSAEVNGLLDVRPLVGKGRASVYAMTYVYSSKKQEAAMILGGGNPVRAWVNGVQVLDYAALPKSIIESDQATLRLNEGWNIVVLKVLQGADGQGLFLRFAGDGVKWSIKKE